MQVLETAHQVGRISVSTAPDVSYKEMTLHCETLMMGKQQKMSCLMNTQNRQESLLIRVSQNSDEKDKVTVSHMPRSFHLVISLFILHAISSNNILSDYAYICFHCSCCTLFLIKMNLNGNWQHGNPFLDQEIPAVPSRSPLPTICAAELQNHPHTFNLPASSPYDNFLKAAGC